MRPSVIASPRPAAALNAIPEHRVLASPGRPRHIAPKEHVSTDYYLTGILAVGGRSSQVVRGIRKEDHEKVAIKSIRRDLLSRRDVTNMNHAIRIQAAIEHANVAELKEFYKSKTHVHLVMELLEGGTVLEHLRQRIMLSESRTKCVVEQTLRAAEHLHDQGIVHRDIKCQNLVYASDDRDVVKLIDFGLGAFWREGDANMSELCGTVSTMAPEVLKQSYTNKVDLWSIGIVAHRMLTGELPERDNDGTPLLSQRLMGRTALARDFVASLLSVDPKVRPSASEALGHPWLQMAVAKGRWPDSLPDRYELRQTCSASTRSVGSQTSVWLRRSTSAAAASRDLLPNMSGDSSGKAAQPAKAKTSFWQRCTDVFKSRRKKAARVGSECSVVPC